jgi:hypothetical protein
MPDDKGRLVQRRVVGRDSGRKVGLAESEGLPRKRSVLARSENAKCFAHAQNLRFGRKTFMKTF